MNPQQPGGPVSYNSGARSGKSILITILLAILLIAALAFGGWAYSQMRHFKNDSDQIAVAAVAKAKKDQAAQLQAQFAEQSKSPFKVFQGSATYGSLTFSYPKTWSAYIDTSNSSEPINGFFYPDIVPAVQSQTAYALRVEMISTDYSQVMQQFSSNITRGTVTARAYVPPKMQGASNVVPGTLLSGQTNNQSQTQRGQMLVIKVRDKTLEISTQANTFFNDFNNTVLAGLTYVP
jgi:predicted lipid-binding transport protein (Tim44 family)